MKKQRLLTTVLLALAGAGLMASSSKAALTYSADDLFIGFYTTGNGSTSDYLVDIGQASSFRDATGAFTINVSGINADLTSVFGSDWKTRDDVFWGIFGATSTTAVGSDPKATLYIGSPETTIGTPSVGYFTSTNTTQITPANKIKSLGNEFVLNGTATSNNSVGTIQSLPETNSFAFNLSNNGQTLFSYFDGSLGNFGAGTSGTALDLFRLAPSSSLNTAAPGTDLGVFSINDSGIVKFTPTAVPEPSTYGLVIGAGTILMTLARRRNKLKNS